MSAEEKKPATTVSTSPPPPTVAPPVKPLQPVAAPQTAKKPTVSRRTFLKVAIGASTVLAGVSLAGSGVSQKPGTQVPGGTRDPSPGGILQPLVPTPLGETTIANAADLETQYDAIRGSGNVVFKFFYWPYDITVSPYYRNILVRLPDEILDPSIRGSTPNLAHFRAWNTTCVHLRCLVNPALPVQTDGEYRLLCPCHGSQYRMIDAVPVKGPAFDLGLGLAGLPRIVLSMDPNNNLKAEKFDGDPGIGRTDY